MRKAPLIISAILLAIQIARVANFADAQMGAGLLGWAFSASIAAGVFVSAYHTRQAITRKDDKADRRSLEAQRMAYASLIMFVFADGYFNLADVLTTVDTKKTLILVSAIIYGASPTLFSAILAALQGKIDRLPVAPNAKQSQINAQVSAWIRNAWQRVVERQEKAHVERKVEQVKRNPLTAYCDFPDCGWSHNGYKNARGAKAAQAAHGKKHAVAKVTQ